MRILFVNRMASMVRGGGETFDLEMARHLEKMGCEISFLSGIPLGGRALLPLSATKLGFSFSNFTIRSPYTGWFPWDKFKGGWRLRLADFWIFEKRAAAWALSHQDRFDIVQVCELPTFVAAWKKNRGRLPVVMRLTAPNYVDTCGALKKADGLIASGMTLDQVRHIRPDCLDVPNAVDSERFRPHASSFRAEHGLGANDLIVLYVARFQDFKNHALLLDAFHLLLGSRSDAWLVLAGSGPLENRMRLRARELGVESRTLFLGEVPFEKLPDVYAAADIKAISSTFESFCFAALEAMATGLSIVTTDCGWVPRLIEENRGGQVTPLNNASALAEALDYAGCHPDERSNWGAFNRDKVVRSCSWMESARKLYDLYEHLA